MVIRWNWLLIVNWIFSLLLIQSKKVLLLCDSHCTISLENPLLPCTKKFFCFLCYFLRLKIINCIFQCVKTRLSNWQWCSLAYLTCYQDTFEEENENVVHNKEEKKSFFLENWREKWKEKKDEKDKQWRKTHTETVEKSELKKRCVSERSIGISRIFLQDNLIFSTLTISSPLPFSKKNCDVPKFKRTQRLPSWASNPKLEVWLSCLLRKVLCVCMHYNY